MAVITEKPPQCLYHREEFIQLRNEMLSQQQVLFKARVNVLFWPQMNPVSEHPHAPAVLFHPAKHYSRFISASVTAGWRYSLTQFCHCNLGQPQHFQYYVYFCSSHHFNGWVREPLHVQSCWQNWGGEWGPDGAEGSSTGVPVARTAGWPFPKAHNKQI